MTNSKTLQLARSTIAGILICLLEMPVAQAFPLQAQSQQPTQQMPEAPSPQLVDPSTRANSMQSGQQQNSNPVGTAAAPESRPTGVAASRPAGAVIAPSKQKRRKAILIRVGIIVGAAVAVGTVAGLSRSSSARP